MRVSIQSVYNGYMVREEATPDHPLLGTPGYAAPIRVFETFDHVVKFLHDNLDKPVELSPAEEEKRSTFNWSLLKKDS